MILILQYRAPEDPVSRGEARLARQQWESKQFHGIGVCINGCLRDPLWKACMVEQAMVQKLKLEVEGRQGVGASTRNRHGTTRRQSVSIA